MMKAAALRGVMPKAFWTLSLKEWRALFGDAGGVIGRSDLSRLMDQHPDKEGS